MFNKFRKVNEKYKLLERGGNLITSPDEIADLFTDHYANILRDDPHKISKPGENRMRKKKEELPYNKSFTDKGLKAARKQQNNREP